VQVNQERMKIDEVVTSYDEWQKLGESSHQPTGLWRGKADADDPRSGPPRSPDEAGPYGII
jgi:hypothetical protein